MAWRRSTRSRGPAATSTGAPRMHVELAVSHGVRVGRKRVERLIRQAGLSGLMPESTAELAEQRARPGVQVGNDLAQRQFRRPMFCSWTTFTYLRTWRGATSPWSRSHSRQIVGWSMAERMRQAHVIDALKHAVSCHRPDPGLIHHSDRTRKPIQLVVASLARGGLRRAVAGGACAGREPVSWRRARIVAGEVLVPPSSLNEVPCCGSPLLREGTRLPGVLDGDGRGGRPATCPATRYLKAMPRTFSHLCLARASYLPVSPSALMFSTKTLDVHGADAP